MHHHMPKKKHKKNLISHSHHRRWIIQLPVVTKMLQILLDCVDRLIDIVLLVLIRSHHRWGCKVWWYDVRNMRAHETLHEFTNHVPAIRWYYAWTIFDLWKAFFVWMKMVCCIERDFHLTMLLPQPEYLWTFDSLKRFPIL